MEALFVALLQAVAGDPAPTIESSAVVHAAQEQAANATPLTGVEVPALEPDDPAARHTRTCRNVLVAGSLVARQLVCSSPYERALIRDAWQQRFDRGQCSEC